MGPASGRRGVSNLSLPLVVPDYASENTDTARRDANPRRPECQTFRNYFSGKGRKARAPPAAVRKRFHHAVGGKERGSRRGGWGSSGAGAVAGPQVGCRFPPVITAGYSNRVGAACQGRITPSWRSGRRWFESNRPDF